MRRYTLIVTLVAILLALTNSKAIAQRNNNHIMFSASALYERGLNASIGYEHSTKYHNAWEYFATYYVKYDEDPLAGHCTKDSFWNSYRTWHVGILYKPCVKRGRNHYGNLRLGASGGSNTKDFLGGVHIGYEHSYMLFCGWELFFQVEEDVIIPKRNDLFRTGIGLGLKIPLNN